MDVHLHHKEKNMRKIVTICGSLRFFDRIQETAERLELENGWIVFTPIPHTLDRELKSGEKQLLGDIHKAKIDLSHAIFVVNVGGYIGDAVRKEIEYAKELGKEIFFLENSNQ